jgi:hypothetical protein
MDGIYNSLAVNAEKAYEKLVTKNPARFYLGYAYDQVTTLGPRTVYVNRFEPEYTPKAVKFNLPIVLGMFAATWALSELVIRARCNKNQP